MSAAVAGRRIRVLHQRRDDLARAGRLRLRGLAGRQTKILRRLGRVAGARRVERAFDPDLADVRIERKPGIEPGVFIVRWNGWFSSLPGTSLVARNVTPTVCSPALTGMRGVALPLPRRVRDFLIPIEQLHALAIDRDFELLALDAAEDRLEVTGDALDLEGYSPSAGNSYLIRMPPRVPNGRPSTW